MTHFRPYGPAMENAVEYDLGPGVVAYSPFRDFVAQGPVVQMHQVHGDRIAIVDSPGLTRQELDGYDALITALPGVAIGARTADCVPVLLYDPINKVVAAVHSGWKGTVLRISARALEKMNLEFGTLPENVRAAIGPCIGPESFQVGPEVVVQFAAAGFPADPYGPVSIVRDCGPKVPGTMRGGLHIDLWEANRMVLEQAGIRASNITLAGIDTYTDVRFFSARREGPSCGRTVNCISLVK